ncbi:MAG: HAD-IA family hydrolase [Candidatus Buchananbacteria bacterium]|nr:HAD-IA family hydrolase [Candidatus Buchananbacteria bacterium]
MSQNKKILLFDFDGVIVDTFELAYGLHQDLEVKISPEEFRDLFMGNLYTSLKSARPQQDQEQWAKKWFELYKPKLLKTAIHPGMTETINQLASDYQLTIISSAVSNIIEEYLKTQQLDHLFDLILGADVHLDKTEKIEMVLQKQQAQPADCLFITDTVGDVLEAAKKQIQSIAVTWGFHPPERFAANPPTAFANNPKELYQHINNYFNQNNGN